MFSCTRLTTPLIQGMYVSSFHSPKKPAAFLSRQSPSTEFVSPMLIDCSNANYMRSATRT